jgi:hypothetical protein
MKIRIPLSGCAWLKVGGGSAKGLTLWMSGIFSTDGTLKVSSTYCTNSKQFNSKTKGKKTMNKTKICIVIRNGSVEGIYSDNKNLEAAVIDFDVMYADSINTAIQEKRSMKEILNAVKSEYAEIEYSTNNGI